MGLAWWWLTLLLVLAVLVVAGLTFLPALSLGPIAEALS